MTQLRGTAIFAFAFLQVWAWAAYGPASAQNRPMPNGSFRVAETADEKKKREEEEKKKQPQKQAPQPAQQQPRQAPPPVQQPQRQAPPPVQQPQRQAPPPQQLQQRQERQAPPSMQQPGNQMRGGQDDPHRQQQMQQKSREDADRRKAAEDGERKKQQMQQQQMRDAQQKTREDADRRKAAEDDARKKQQMQQQQTRDAQQKAREDAERQKRTTQQPQVTPQPGQMQRPGGITGRDDLKTKQTPPGSQNAAPAGQLQKPGTVTGQDDLKTRQAPPGTPGVQQPAQIQKPGTVTGQDGLKTKQTPPGMPGAQQPGIGQPAVTTAPDMRKGPGDGMHRQPGGDPAKTAGQPGLPPKGAIAPPPVAKPPVDPRVLEVRKAKDIEIQHKLKQEKEATKHEKSKDQVDVRLKIQTEHMQVLHRGRQEHRDNEGRTVIKEPGNRVIIRDPSFSVNLNLGGAKRHHGPTGVIIMHDETERFRRHSRDVRVERHGHESHAHVRLPNGAVIINVTDENGRTMRRIRRDRHGGEVVLFDNGPVRAGIGFGFMHGLRLNIAPPVIDMPPERYIMSLEDATEEDIAEVLYAPPIEDLGRGYTLDEVLHNVSLRQRMRSIDIDTLTFDFGAWEVAPEQYDRLETIASVMNDILSRNPNEMFLIEGHTDAVGSDEDNLSLSDRRSESVAAVLSQQFNVPMENLVTQGYGWHHLKIDTDGPERLNRRATVRRISPLLESGYSAAQ